MPNDPYGGLKLVAGLQKIFERPGPPLVMGGVQVQFPHRYERSENNTNLYMAQLCAVATIPHRTLDGAEEIQLYVDEVLRMPWPRWHAGPSWAITVRVVPGLNASNGTALYASGNLYVPPVVNELIVLHEIAHYLSPVATGFHGTLVPSYHNDQFVAAFLDLVDKVLNPAALQLFRECLAAEGISA